MNRQGKVRSHRRDDTDSSDQQQEFQSAQGLLPTPQQPVQYMLVPVPVTPTGQYQDPRQYYQQYPIPAQYVTDQLASGQYLRQSSSRTHENQSSRGQKTSKGNLKITGADSDDEQLHRFETTDDTQSDIPDVDDNEVFKFVIKRFGGGCTYNDFAMQCDLFEDKSSIPRWFSKNIRRFKIYKDGSKIVYISPFYNDMKICTIYNHQFGNCSNANCDFFHVCRKFVWGHCKNSDCKLAHSFKTPENRLLKEKLGITDFTDADIKVVLNSNSPCVCYDYLYNEGCKIPNFEKRCPYLHLCRDHVFKKCRTPCKNKMTHSLKQFHNNWVLTSLRMNKWSEQRVLKSIYVPPRKRDQLDDSDLSDDYDEHDIGLSSDYIDSDTDDINDQQPINPLHRSVENIGHDDETWEYEQRQRDRKVDRKSRFKSTGNLADGNLNIVDQHFEKMSVTKGLGYSNFQRSLSVSERNDVETRRGMKEAEPLMMRHGQETEIQNNKEEIYPVFRRSQSTIETKKQLSRQFMGDAENKDLIPFNIQSDRSGAKPLRSVLKHYENNKHIEEKDIVARRDRHVDIREYAQRPSSEYYVDTRVRKNERSIYHHGDIDAVTEQSGLKTYDNFIKTTKETEHMTNKNMDTKTRQPAFGYNVGIKAQETDRLMAHYGYVQSETDPPASSHHRVRVDKRLTKVKENAIMADDLRYRKPELLKSNEAPFILHSHDISAPNIRKNERLPNDKMYRQQNVFERQIERRIPHQKPSFEKRVNRLEYEDHDQALLRDKSSNTNICVFVLSDMCSSTYCTLYHLTSGTPYLWQLQMFGTWVPFAPQENEGIEKSFCNLEDSVRVKIVHDKMKFRYLIHFDKAMYGVIDGEPSMDDQKCDVRRLSTPSYAEHPSNQQGSYPTHWKWYFRDNAHQWTSYDEDIQPTLEKQYLFGGKTHSFIHDNFHYIINFENMTQLNQNTKRTRQITRRPLIVSNVDVVLKKFFSTDISPTADTPRQIIPNDQDY